MYRLTNEVSTSSLSSLAYTRKHEYDKAGNRVKQTRGTETITYQYNANDQLTNEVSSVSGTTTYLYDANGSLTNKTTSGGTISYAYSLGNKLSSVTVGGVTTSYLYNDAGIRVRSVTGTSTNLYLVDANNHTGYAQVLEELSTIAGAPSRSYVIGDDVLGQATSTTTSWLLYDGHGSTRQLVKAGADVTSQYHFDGYGASLTTLPSNPETSLLYSGEQFDSTLQMYNLRARYYDQNTGRFNQRDAFAGVNSDPQSLHKYAYASLDPVNGNDPSGKFTVAQVSVAFGIGAGIGALATVATTYAFEGRMATIGEIFAGAALGGLFAVGGFLVPELGILLAGYGIITTGASSVGLWADPNVSWDRKVLAAGLFVATAYGGSRAIEYTKVMRGYVPQNPNNASLVPESYMNKLGAVDMRAAPAGGIQNKAGFPRNNNWFFRQLLEKFPDWFSPDNRAAILAGRKSPIVDETWTAHFPEHVAYLGKPLVHHHVLQGPVAVPIPRPVHQNWTGALHPGVPNVVGPPAGVGGIVGGLVEDTISDEDIEE